MADPIEPNLLAGLITAEELDNLELSDNNMLVTPEQTTRPTPDYDKERAALEKVSANFGDNLTNPQKYSGMSPVYGTRIDGINYEDYSRYIDRPFSFVSEDVDEIRAQNQGTGEKWRYGATKFVGKVGTNILGSTIGLVYGGVAYLNSLVDENSPTKDFYDNNFQRSLDGINDWMDGKLPNYYTKQEQEYGFWKSMGTANFWANDFTQGLSFVVGAVMSEGLTAGRVSSLFKNMAKKSGVKGKDWLKEANKAAQTAGGSVATLKQMQNGLTTVRQLGVGAMYESGVEARHHYDATLEMLVEKHKEDNNGIPPSDKEMVGYVDIATKSANAVFAGNLALVGYGNYMMFPKIFGKGLNSTKRALAGKIKKEVVDKKQLYSELFKDLSKGQVFTRNAWKLAKVPLYEGFVEEGGQKLLDLSGQGAAEDFYLSKRNPNMMDMVGELLVHTESAFSEAYGSKEGQKEIGIGFILGALGLPGRVSTRTKDGKVKKKLTMKGGVWDTFRNIKAQEAAITKLRTRLENDPNFISSFKKSYDALIRAGHIQDISDYATVIDNPYISQNAEHDAVFNYMHSRMEAGFEQDILDELDHIRNMSVDEFRDAFNYNEANDYSDKELEARRDGIALAMEQKLESIKENMDIMDRAFVNWSSDQKMAAVHALSVAKDSDIREDELIKKVEDIVGSPIEADIEISKEERDAVEESNTKSRAKNIWFRLTGNQRKKINTLPEAQVVKQRLGIREFSDPSHLEELYRELTLKAVSLEKQIEEIGNNDNLDDYSKDSKLIKLAADKKKLDQRFAELSKALNEGLDPNIGASEQQYLDEWKKKDPTGYASESQNVITMLKDLRKLRARRHRAINMYNQLLEKREIGKTLFSEGALITPPQIRLDRMLERQSVANDALFEDDPRLHDMYRRFSDQTIEFEYTREKETEPTRYRVFVERKEVENGDAQVLRQLPTADVIKLELEKQKLENKKARFESVVKRLSDNVTSDDYAEAQTEIANIEIQLNDINTILETKKVGKALTLNILNKASGIKIIENSVLVKEQVNQTVDLVRDQLNSELLNANSILENLTNKFAIMNKELEDPNTEDTQVEALKTDIENLNEAISDVKRTINETKTNLQVLQGFEAKTETVTTLPQAENLINSIYESLFKFDKVGEYKEVYDLINKSAISNLIITTTDGKNTIDNDKLQRYAEILKDGQDVTSTVLAEFDPQIGALEESTAILKENINKIGEAIKLNKLKKGQEFQNPSLRQPKNVNPEDVKAYEAEIKEYNTQIKELDALKQQFKDEVLNVQRAVNAITGLAFDLKDHLYAIKSIIDRYKNPGAVQENESDYFDTNMMALNTNEFLNKVGESDNKGIMHYRSPITKHGFLKTAGSNVASLKTIQALEQQVKEGVPLTPEQTNEYNLAKSGAAFYKFTSSNNFNTKKYKDGKGKFSLALVNRKNLPADLQTEVVFYDNGKYNLAPNTSATLNNEALEDIKAIVIDEEGKPYKVNGVLLYTSIPTAEVFEEKQAVDEEGNPTELINMYKYGKADLEVNSIVEHLIIDEEGNTKTVLTGTPTATAAKRIEEYKTFRTDLLTSPQPKVRKIVQNSFAMVNKVSGDNTGRPSKTFKGGTSNIDLKVSIKTGLSISGRAYNFSPGTVVAEVAGKPVPMYGNFLSENQKKNVLNLLKLYAINQRKYKNGELSYTQAQLVEPANPNSKRIERILKDIVYFGMNTQTMGERNFFIFTTEEGGTIHFGDLKIEMSKLLDPENNVDLNDDLESFVGSLRHNVNAYSLKSDQEARAKGKARGTYSDARKSYAKRVKNDKEKLAKWEENNAYRKSNAKVEYEGYTEYIVNDDMTVTTHSWTNYTDYLLGDGSAETRRATPAEIPLYSYLNDHVAEDKDKSYNTPQFLNTYLQYEEGYDTDKMPNLETFKAKKAEEAEETVEPAKKPKVSEPKVQDIGSLQVVSKEKAAELMGLSVEELRGDPDIESDMPDLSGTPSKHDTSELDSQQNCNKNKK